MLQALRDKSSGWIATVILGLLVVPFAFFGMEQYLFQRNDTFVAKIEAPPKWWRSAPAWWPVTMLWQREEVGADEFRTAFEQARQQQRTAQGEQFDPREFESADNKRSVLDSLIDQQVLQMSAGRAGVAIGDAQVRDAIQAIPAFQVDGKFDPQRYQLALGSQIPRQTPQAVRAAHSRRPAAKADSDAGGAIGLHHGIGSRPAAETDRREARRIVRGASRARAPMQPQSAPPKSRSGTRRTPATIAHRRW